MNLPRATRRCLDCGIASGPCVCTREFAMWEAEQEELEERAHGGLFRPSEDSIEIEGE